ncbi:hypothetical protein M569_11573 [Genlisea aurea]|uniref:Uncharacterized protein n=1 Tax=Genlisea aurea TaxID=192259 RepID=S8C8L1_9LAMI|nr:hypothetical protein M569_11573 [Genlisea aurea]
MPRGRPRGVRGRAGGGQARGNNLPAEDPPYPDLHRILNKNVVPLFDPDNFHIWSLEMTSHLQAEGCFGAIDAISNGWDRVDEDRKLAMRVQAFNVIRLSLGPSYRHVWTPHPVGDAGALWAGIRAMYVQNNIRTKLRLNARLQSLEWDTTHHHVDSFLAEMNDIQVEYASAGIPLADDMAFSKLLTVLPQEFDIERSKMEEWDVPDFARARALLLTRENMLRERREYQTERPISTGTSFIIQNRFAGIKRCYHCDRPGHMKAQCSKWKQTQRIQAASNESAQNEQMRGRRSGRGRGRRDNRGGRNGRRPVLNENFPSTNAIAFEGQGGDNDPFQGANTEHQSLTMVEHDVGFICMMNSIAPEGWIMDTGASRHLCKDKSYFSSLEPITAALLTGKSKTLVEVNEYGHVELEPIENDEGIKHVQLTRVYYSPDASFNLLAINPFIDRGCTVDIRGDRMTINHQGRVIVRGERGKSGLYVVSSHSVRLIDEIALSLKYKDKSEVLRLLHNRLGHLHGEGIKKMIRENMALGLPQELDLTENTLNCPSCVGGKMTRQPYPKSDESTEDDTSRKNIQVGDELCSDTFGPMNTISRYGNKHIVEFIDRASSFAFMFGIPTLDTVVSRYSLVRNIFDTQLKIRIKNFRSDGHGCYDNKELRRILAQDGTMFKMRTPYCPEQNSMAERRIRTTVEMARTMMIQSSAPSYCWEDAVQHANHIRNRVISRATRGMTPYEKFWEKKPDLQWLRPFGCLTYVLIHKERRQGKFEAVAEPGVLMGMSPEHSGYRVHMLNDGSIRVARDVQFFEDIYPFRKGPITDLQWMNPLDCPKSSLIEESSGVYKDAFLKLDHMSSKIRRDADLADLYRKRTWLQEGNMDLKKRRKGEESKDEQTTEIAGTSSETVILYQDKIKLTHPSEILNDFIIGGMIFNIMELDMKAELDGPNNIKWIEAFKTEYGAIMKTGTFTPMTPTTWKLLREGKIKVHKTRPILVHKFDEKGQIARFKVRLVVKGFTMVQGVDYDKTFSPCARMNTVRMVIAWATAFKWDVTHSDVPNAYLNGKTLHTVVIQLPPMWTEIIGDSIGRNGEPAVMSNSLYGAPDAGRNWNGTYVHAFVEEGYVQCSKEPCLFRKGQYPMVAIFVIVVDDSYATGSDVTEIDRMHQKLKERFNIKILGRLSYSLGIAFT